jgi:hypothetical protein
MGASAFTGAIPSGYSAWCPSVACDPYFGNVVLLMGYEGANGSTGAPGWNDLSPAAHGTASNSGNTFIDTSQFKFGASSGHWNIALTPKGAAYFGASNDWEFGSGKFTVETWIRFNSTSATMMLLGTVQPGDIGWYWHMDAANNLVWTVTTDGSTQLNDITYAWSPSLATWYFITVDYDGAKYRMYVNGAMVGSSTTARNIWNSGEALGIGTNSIASGLWLDGWLDELRITKGVARYASDSGFVVPTAAFPRVACPITTTFSATMSANQFINSNANSRIVIPSASLSTNGTKVRITFNCPTSSGAYPIEHCYIGHADQTVNPWNFNGTQVPLTFSGGSLGVTLPLSGSPVVSDWINYPLDHTKPFIIATHGNFSSGDTVRTGVVTGVSSYVKGAADETSVSVVTGYSGSANTVFMISLIEVQ